MACLLLLVCPDVTEPLDSDDSGFTLTIVDNNGGTDQDPEEALPNYMGQSLELNSLDFLKLTSMCETGSGTILSVMMEVSDVTSVTVTYITSTGEVQRTVIYN